MDEIPRWTLNTTPVEVCRGHSVLYIHQGSEVVAQVWTPSFYGTATDNRNEWYRRARLLAASPDLLLIARAYVELADSILTDVDRAESEWPGLSDALAHARAALARAEGGGA